MSDTWRVFGYCVLVAATLLAVDGIATGWLR